MYMCMCMCVCACALHVSVGMYMFVCLHGCVRALEGKVLVHITNKGSTRFNKLPFRTKLQTACEQGSLWLIECSLKIINIQYYKMH